MPVDEMRAKEFRVRARSKNEQCVTIATERALLPTSGRGRQSEPYVDSTKSAVFKEVTTIMICWRQISLCTPSFKLLGLAVIGLLLNADISHAGNRFGHASCCGKQDVIVIRGGAGYWPGAQAMADHFTNLGYASTVIFGWESIPVADEIAEAMSKGRMNRGLVIVGYSSGADYACIMAGRLEKYGIRVSTMVLIESTLGVPVPANVDYCVNFYESRRWDRIPVFRGVPVQVAGSQTILYNINVKSTPQFVSLSTQNHFTICNTESLRQTAGTIVAARHPNVAAAPVANIAAAPPAEPPVVSQTADSSVVK